MNAQELMAKAQSERHGYFVADEVAHAAGKIQLNLTMGLKDS